MITEFNTSAPAGGGGNGASKGGNGMFTVLVVAAVLFAGYVFVVKPMMEKNQRDDQG